MDQLQTNLKAVFDTVPDLMRSLGATATIVTVVTAVVSTHRDAIIREFGGPSAESLQ